MKLSKTLRSIGYQIKQQPLMMGITILGTALSIFLIMVVVMIQQVKTAPFAPESNRDRFLHYTFISTRNENWDANSSNNNPLSYSGAREMLLNLPTPEAATAYQSFLETNAYSMPGAPAVNGITRAVDDKFWHVFDFAFIDGKPFTKADFDAGIPLVVISESLARDVFGTTEAAGREIQLNLAPFRVAGVVRDVSSLASKAYAQAWPNLSATPTIDDTWASFAGNLAVTILARSRDDFAQIRSEYEKAEGRYGDMLKVDGMQIIRRERPYDQETESLNTWANMDPDLATARRNRWLTYLILLIVPAINLSSMTQSRMRQRTAEIGVRRTFGCKRSRIAIDIVAENMVITLIGGILGLALCVIFSFMASGLLFAQMSTMEMTLPKVDASMLLQWSTFGWALLFCFVLNLLSSGIPAVRASRVGIVKALNGK